MQTAGLPSDADGGDVNRPDRIISPKLIMFSINDCIECGCCAYVCPSQRPLVQHLRRAKAEITAKRRAAAAK